MYFSVPFVSTFKIKLCLVNSFRNVNESTEKKKHRKQKHHAVNSNILLLRKLPNPATFPLMSRCCYHIRFERKVSKRINKKNVHVIVLPELRNPLLWSHSEVRETRFRLTSPVISPSRR